MLKFENAWRFESPGKIPAPIAREFSDIIAKIARGDPSLKIIDDGAERAVESGFIDITCDDGKNIVVIELKAGKADSRAIGQTLGYMGDLQGEEEKPVRGILVAHDFDQRVKSAARVVPNLTLKKYAIAFTFSDVD